MPGAALRGYGRAYMNNGGAAWTRKEGKSESGGLNQKGRDSYKAQTGGTLKPPTKSKTNPRRKSFCARMTGMKKKSLDVWANLKIQIKYQCSIYVPMLQSK